MIAVLLVGLSSVGISYTMPKGQSLDAQAVEAMSLGDAWMNPKFTWTQEGHYFETEIFLDSEYEEIGAFSMMIDYTSYDHIVKAVSSSQEGSADITVNMNEPGIVRFNGYNKFGFPKVSGTTHIKVITIRWLALSKGDAGLNLTVKTLGTAYGSEFSGQIVRGGVVIVS